MQQTARELIVLALHRERRISSGKAAELLRIPKELFITRSSEVGIPVIDMAMEEFESELSEAEKILLERRR
jgi:hypothetical protein